jgi:hypothetical protein
LARLASWALRGKAVRKVADVAGTDPPTRDDRG